MPAWQSARSAGTAGTTPRSKGWLGNRCLRATVHEGPTSLRAQCPFLRHELLTPLPPSSLLLQGVNPHRCAPRHALQQAHPHPRGGAYAFWSWRPRTYASGIQMWEVEEVGPAGAPRNTGLSSKQEEGIRGCKLCHPPAHALSAGHAVHAVHEPG